MDDYIVIHADEIDVESIPQDLKWTRYDMDQMADFLRLSQPWFARGDYRTTYMIDTPLGETNLSYVYANPNRCVLVRRTPSGKYEFAGSGAHRLSAAYQHNLDLLVCVRTATPTGGVE